MGKIWSQLTDSEKIEELRRDTLNIMARVNQLDVNVDLLSNGIGDLAEKLANLERRVEAARKDPKASGKSMRSVAKKPRL